MNGAHPLSYPGRRLQPPHWRWRGIERRSQQSGTLADVRDLSSDFGNTARAPLAGASRLVTRVTPENSQNMESAATRTQVLCQFGT